MPNFTVYSGFARFGHNSPWILSPVSLTAMSSLLLVLITSYVYRIFSANDAKKIHQLGGISIFNTWEFFDKRYDFLRLNREKTGQDLFSFKVFHVSVSRAVVQLVDSDLLTND